MDVTLRQPILSANFYMGRLPDSHAGRYFAARDAGAEFLVKSMWMAIRAPT